MPSRNPFTRVGQRLRRGLDPHGHTPLFGRWPSLRDLAQPFLTDDTLARADAARVNDLGHGHDALGLSREGVAMGLAITEALYTRYFRVTSHGVENIPAEGPVILAANHSGTLPIDGMMIWADVVRRSPTGRVPRVVMDYFVGRIPLIAEVFARAGAVGGARGNFHELLRQGEMILVFPEGTKGIGKPFSQRYQLQRWSEGHAELAIRHGATIVPVAVIGAEEQMPQVARIDWIHAFGAPYLPIPATLIPLPVHYHLWYGPPIRLHDVHAPGEATNPAVVAKAARQVRGAVAALIDQGLSAREGVFL